MNSYSLASDSRRWWWPSATAGAFAAAAIVAILFQPASGTAAPTGPAIDQPPLTSQTNHHRGDPRQCFMWQSRWNDVLNGPQPVCYDPAPVRDDPGPAVPRPGLPQPY